MYTFVYINQTLGTRSVCCSDIRNSDQNNFKLCSQLIARTSGDCWGLESDTLQPAGGNLGEAGRSLQINEELLYHRHLERHKQNTFTCEFLLLINKSFQFRSGVGPLRTFVHKKMKLFRQSWTLHLSLPNFSPFLPVFIVSQYSLTKEQLNHVQRTRLKWVFISNKEQQCSCHERQYFVFCGFINGQF